MSEDFTPTQVDTPRLASVLSELTKPFDPHEIRWRVESSSNDKTKVRVLPYLDARSIQERLDAVVPGEWSLLFRRENLEGPAYVGGHVVFASLTIRGVTREDVGSSMILNTKNYAMHDGTFNKLNESKLDPKTATSDSIKRVAAQFGIGRYLWNFDRAVWIPAKDDKGNNKFDYAAPQHDDIPDWAHKRMFELGLAGRVNAASPSSLIVATELLQYVLKKVSDGEVGADTLIEHLKQHGTSSAAALLNRMNSEALGSDK